jgi:hypothetical protein
VALQPKPGWCRLTVEVAVSHTIRHTPVRTPLNEWSARRRGRHLHNTQQTQQTNIQSVSGIQTRYPSNQAASDLRVRPHDHGDRQQFIPLHYQRIAQHNTNRNFFCGLTVQVSRSHTRRHTHPHTQNTQTRLDSSGRGISPTQRPLPDNTNTHKGQTSMSPAVFEPAIQASERPQTYALDRAATAIGTHLNFDTWSMQSSPQYKLQYVINV